MAGNAGDATTLSWDDIPVIDKVSQQFAPLQGLNPTSITNTHCLAYCSGPLNNWTILLRHEGEKTYLQGRCQAVGLTEACGEREVDELRGKRVAQVAFAGVGNVYILLDDGNLYSSGCTNWGLLGRPDNLVPADRFGEVPIPGAVKQISAMYTHVLAMTKDRVFAFGNNEQCQLGLPAPNATSEPQKVYAGTGAAAPQQVACGVRHSVILTVGGGVLTCGWGGRTGQGHDNNVPKISEVPGLRGHPVLQVGCTALGTYALCDGVLHVWGINDGGQLGLGDTYVGTTVLEPTVIYCRERQITSFRCSKQMVLAITDNGDFLYWGWRKDGIVKAPQLLANHRLPREVFGAKSDTSGGLVFLDTDENHHRVFTKLPTWDAIEFSKFSDDIIQLQSAFAASKDARVTDETRLQTSEAEIRELKRSVQEVNKTSMDARVTAETRLQTSEAEIRELKHSVTENIKAIMDAHISAETNLQKDISELKKSMDECFKRERADAGTTDARVLAAETRLLTSEAEIRELKTHIAQTYLQQLISQRKKSIDKCLKRERASMDARVTAETRLQTSEAEIRELKHSMTENIKVYQYTWYLIVVIAALSIGGGLWRDNQLYQCIWYLTTLIVALIIGGGLSWYNQSILDTEMTKLRCSMEESIKRERAQQAVYGDYGARIAEFERDQHEQRMENMEMSAQLRPAALDVGELFRQHSTHLESCGPLQ